MNDKETVNKQSPSKIKEDEKPYIKILEQPQLIATFQHTKDCNRKLETIKGARSTHYDVTYPTIKLFNHKGNAVAIVSCVTKDPPYFPHPCSIIDKTGKHKDGVYYLRFFSAYPILMFPDLIIARVRKNNVLAALEKRKRMRVDPFKTGFRHRYFPDSMDLNCVRLCFHTFLEDTSDSSYTIPLEPVVSEPIYNDTTSALKIYYISHATASVTGGQVMCILSTKLISGDVQVRFFDLTGWEAYARTVTPHFHRRIAVIFESPKYVNEDIDKPVVTFVELIRPSDGMRSEAISFEFVPWGACDRELFRSQKPKYRESPRDLVLKNLQAESVPGVAECRMKEVHNIKEMQLHKIEQQQYQDSWYQYDKFYQYQLREQHAQQRMQLVEYELLATTSKTQEERIYHQSLERELREHMREMEKRRYYTGQWVLQQQAEQQQQENATEVEQLPQYQFEFDNYNHPEKKESPVQPNRSSSSSTVVNDNLVGQNNVTLQIQMQIVKKLHTATYSKKFKYYEQ